MKTVDREELMDWWLSKYHNTNCKEVVEKHPEEVKSPDWFELYPCTQEQCDEWEKWAKAYIKKELKISKALLDRRWPLTYLDTAPYVKERGD